MNISKTIVVVQMVLAYIHNRDVQANDIKKSYLRFGKSIVDLRNICDEPDTSVVTVRVVGIVRACRIVMYRPVHHDDSRSNESYQNDILI